MTLLITLVSLCCFTMGDLKILLVSLDLSTTSCFLVCYYQSLESVIPKFCLFHSICNSFRDRRPLPVFKVERSMGDLVTLFCYIVLLRGVIPKFRPFGSNGLFPGQTSTSCFKVERAIGDLVTLFSLQILLQTLLEQVIRKFYLFRYSQSTSYFQG